MLFDVFYFFINSLHFWLEIKKDAEPYDGMRQNNPKPNIFDFRFVIHLSSRTGVVLCLHPSQFKPKMHFGHKTNKKGGLTKSLQKYNDLIISIIENFTHS